MKKEELEIEEMEENNFQFRDSVKNFRPLTEEEQKMFLFLCLSSIDELYEKLDNISKKEKTRRQFIDAQIQTYRFIADIFTTAGWFDEVGLPSTKDTMLKIAKMWYEEYFNTKDNGC